MAVTAGQICTWTGTTIGAEPFSSIELRYGGSGQWIVVNQQAITLRGRGALPTS